MTLSIARRGTVAPFIVMDVVRAAVAREAQGKPVWHMEVGQPSTGLPPEVAAELAERMQRDPLGYTVTPGLPALRQRIAAHTARTQGVEVDPGRVVVTTGSSGGFLLAFAACFEVGARVGVAQPGYPAYPSILQSMGIEAVPLPVGPETRYQPTVEMLERLEGGLDGLILASPSNPTGTVIPAEEMKRLCRWCEDRGVRLISDEIYHGIVYDKPAVSALAFSDTAVVVNSFSKYYCMTGWRLGWLILPEPLVRPVECLAQNLFISPPSLSQYAGVAIFDHLETLDARVRVYARNRDRLVAGLPQVGFERFSTPDGAFYLYADVSALTGDSVDLCRRLLDETGVAVTPGVDFDPVRGHLSVRFSFARDEDHIAEALERLKAWRP